MHEMDEIMELRRCIEEQRYQDALLIIDEMDDMAKSDKLNKIYSYAVILLIHRIKQCVEERSTRSWELSIRNSINAIVRVNKRHKSGGTYADLDDIRAMTDEAFDEAVGAASLEIFGGKYSDNEPVLRVLLNREELINEVVETIAEAMRR
jgi:hypothetical protein